MRDPGHCDSGDTFISLQPKVVLVTKIITWDLGFLKRGGSHRPFDHFIINTS